MKDDLDSGFDAVVEFFQKHLKEDCVLHILQIGWDDDGCEVYSTAHVISDVAYKTKGDEEVLGDVERDLYPRKVVSRVAVKNHQTGEWIEKGKTYLALAEERHRNKYSYVIEHETGRKVLWGKEYFNEF
jgi:hypothetical protein